MLDPQARAYLDQVAALNLPPIESLPLDQTRAVFDQNFIRLGGSGAQVDRVEHVEAPGPRGPIRIRLYHPEGAVSRAPLLIFYHGGGYVCGGLDSYDAVCRALAAQSGYVVASVDYRLAPEHPAPGPGDDAYAAFTWLASHVHELAADPERIAVGGDSAGGGLAANVALRARDENGPPILHQLLVYPAVGTATGSESARRYGTGHGLTNERIAFYWRCYVPRPELEELPYVLADRSASLRGLPPATILMAECDPLHDMGVAYAERLSADAVPVELRVYDGMIHAFFSFSAIFDQGRRAVSDAAAALRTAAQVGATP